MINHIAAIYNLVTLSTAVAENGFRADSMHKLNAEDYSLHLFDGLAFLTVLMTKTSDNS